MSNLFAPIKDLLGSCFDFLSDAAQKVWSLAKPVILIGLLIDLVSAKLGWITQILDVYRRILEATAGTSWVVLLLLAFVVVSFFQRRG